MSFYKLIDLPKVIDRRGSLSIVEQLNHTQFEIKRVFWIYDVPGGQSRGGHAYYEQQELIIALSGSFDVHLDSGIEKKLFQLNRSYRGLYVPNLVWREMLNFSTNSVALILSSSIYDPKDYIRNKRLFLNTLSDGGNHRI